VFTRARHRSLSWARCFHFKSHFPKSQWLLSSNLRVGIPSGLISSCLWIELLHACLISPGSAHLILLGFIILTLWKGRAMSLVAGLPPLRTVFETGPTHVGFVVDKVALGQVFLRVIWFSPVNVSFYRHFPSRHPRLGTRPAPPSGGKPLWSRSPSK
jgi:hypothetical protein